MDPKEEVVLLVGKIGQEAGGEAEGIKEAIEAPAVARFRDPRIDVGKDQVVGTDLHEDQIDADLLIEEEGQIGEEDLDGEGRKLELGFDDLLDLPFLVF